MFLSHTARLINASNLFYSTKNSYISNFNSILIQSPDNINFIKKNFKGVSKRKPNLKQFNDLIFAFNVCRYVKSNAIVIANNKSTLGIG